MHIVDRRLNPNNKSLENRQRFLRRAKALVRGAVKKSSEGRDIKDVLDGGEVSIPLEGLREPRFHREGGTRELVLPGNKKFVEGDILPRSGDGGAGKPGEPGEGDGEDAFRFELSRDEFVDLFLDDLELPDLGQTQAYRDQIGGLAPGRLYEFRLAGQYLHHQNHAARDGAPGGLGTSASDGNRKARSGSRRE